VEQGVARWARGAPGAPLMCRRTSADPLQGEGVGEASAGGFIRPTLSVPSGSPGRPAASTRAPRLRSPVLLRRASSDARCTRGDVGGRLRSSTCGQRPVVSRRRRCVLALGSDAPRGQADMQARRPEEPGRSSFIHASRHLHPDKDAYSARRAPRMALIKRFDSQGSASPAGLHVTVFASVQRKAHMVQDEGGQAPPGPQRPVLTRCLSQQPARAIALGAVNSMLATASAIRIPDWLST